MDDVIVVQVVQRAHKLLCNVLNLILWQILVVLQDLK